MFFRFRFLEQGAHTHIRLFAGLSANHTLAKCGDLAMRNEEWKVFRNALESVPDWYHQANFEFRSEEEEHSTLIPR